MGKEDFVSFSEFLDEVRKRFNCDEVNDNTELNELGVSREDFADFLEEGFEIGREQMHYLRDDMTLYRIFNSFFV